MVATQSLHDLSWRSPLLLSVAGPAFEPFAVPTFERCERIVTAQLQAQAQAHHADQHAQGNQARAGIHFPDMDRDFVISSLDLVSGLAEGLGPSVQGLVARSQLRSMVLQCCRVRTFAQSASLACKHLNARLCLHACMLYTHPSDHEITSLQPCLLVLDCLLCSGTLAAWCDCHQLHLRSSHRLAGASGSIS